MLSCRVEGVTSARSAERGAREADRPAAASAWVRTVDGWERPDLWVATTAWEPGIHPLVVAAGQGLASVMALVAFGNMRGRASAVLSRTETRAQRGRRC